MKLFQTIATWSLSTGLVLAAEPKKHDISDFDWSVLEPSASLKYQPCYDGHKCAKLLVPLDWLNSSNPARVTLAVIARPAVVDETDPSFGGTVFTNPGGLSASGIKLVLDLGEQTQKILDGNKKYEILSFDPRGVGLSTPNADCFRDEYTRNGYLLEDRLLGKPDSAPEILKRKFAQAAMVGKLCEATDATENIRKFMSTSSVARDMVQIVDILAEMRNETATRDETLEDVQIPLDSHRNAKQTATPRIQYWGFSYGTVLGNTFSSMFPGRVGRMILEAVEDPVDYYNATWILNLKDTQKALDYLWDTCFEGGTRCPLYDPTDKAPADIERKVRNLMGRLDENPEVYISPDTVTTITKQDIIFRIFVPLYNPMDDFPDIAATLADALAGNFTRLVQHLKIPKPTDSCPSRQPSAYTYPWVKEAQHAIACGDGEPQVDMTIEKFQEYLGVLKKDSPDFGGFWSAIRLACSGWRIRANYTFSGPWVTPKHDPSGVDGKPAAPLLLVSSLIDPVTPLANAYEVAKGHPGSVVLIQDNVGHGTIETPGKCRDEFIKAYMETGQLPDKKDVFCKADCKPFQECPGHEVGLGSRSSLRSYEL
uniref:Peptidase S33 tripeptidyl aminopeptidase-like C-terminal domain-containing protein n=1 Tax=Bionectria ochroleuca TaxID=29856 RepID=A0A8H7K9W4_BIOOC